MTLSPAVAARRFMALTQLDAVAALVVIDLQKGVVGLPAVHPTDDIIGRTAQLARAFRERGWPVILVNVAGRAPGRVDAKFNFSPAADWTELVPQLERQPGDYPVTKLQIGAFYGTALERIMAGTSSPRCCCDGSAKSSRHRWNITARSRASTFRRAHSPRCTSCLSVAIGTRSLASKLISA